MPRLVTSASLIRHRWVRCVDVPDDSRHSTEMGSIFLQPHQDDPMECAFFFEVLAPAGLQGLDKALAQSGLGLDVCLSHFNNKYILRSRSELIELGMETSSNDVMQGSGMLFCDFEASVALMKQLSAIFREAGYPHCIGIDDENGDNTVWIRHDFPPANAD